MHRRALLAGFGATVSALAGCASRTRPDGAGAAGAERTPPLSSENDAFGTDFSSGGAWPVSGYDSGRRGVNPDTSPPRDEVGAAWLRTPVAGHRSFWTTPPVTDAERVYVGSGSGLDDDGSEPGGFGGFVAAFDARSGTRVWRTTLTNGIVRGLARTGSSIVCVVVDHDADHAALVALRTTDGDERWRLPLPPDASGGPIVVEGRVIVVARQEVQAVSVEGDSIWERSFVTDLTDEYLSTPACATESTLFVPTDRGRLVGYAVEDGRRRWRASVVAGGHRPRIQTLPTVVGDTVYVTGTDYRLYAVSADDGTPRWDTRLLEQSRGNAIPSVAVLEETIYVNTIHGGLIALTRSDGSERWRATTGGGGNPPAVADDVVVAPTTGGDVEGYSTAGEQRWRFEVQPFDAGRAGYVMDPAIALAHDRVYVTLNDGRVFSLGDR